MTGIQIAQLRGIVYYEFRMLWRERGLLVITLAIVAMVLLTSIIASTNEGVGQSATPLELLREGQFNIAQPGGVHDLVAGWGFIGADRPRCLWPI